MMSSTTTDGIMNDNDDDDNNNNNDIGGLRYRDHTNVVVQQQQRPPPRPRLVKVKEEYNGIFGSSICGMFEGDTNRSSRTDACALACCGVWLWERNQFLVHGMKPKPWKKRPLEILLIFLTVLLFTLNNVLTQDILIEEEEKPKTYNAYNNNNPTILKEENQIYILSKIFFYLFVLWFIVLICVCCKFQNSRNKLRYELAVNNFYKSNPQLIIGEHIEHNNPTQTQLNYYLSNNSIEIYNAHSCCNCIQIDTTPITTIDQQQQQLSLNDDNDHIEDFCTKLWKCLASLCCRSCCQCWCQCCGVCAIAQEHRHLQQLYQQQQQQQQQSSSQQQQQQQQSYNNNNNNNIYQKQYYYPYDYITFQPWSDYKRLIIWIRYTKQNKFSSHSNAMSILSKRILYSVKVFIILMILFAILPFIRFKISQLIVLLGTILQPIIILFFVYWYWYKFDISLDCIIKLFTSGFIICTSMSLLYEIIISIITSTIIFFVAFFTTLLDILSGNATIEDNEGNEYNDYNSYYKEHNSNTAYNNNNNGGYYGGDDDDEPRFILPESLMIGLSMFSAFLNAFIVAASVEELCKYLSFWMIEHPDFITTDNNTNTNTNININNNNNNATMTTSSNRGEDVTIIEEETSLSLTGEQQEPKEMTPISITENNYNTTSSNNVVPPPPSSSYSDNYNNNNVESDGVSARTTRTSSAATLPPQTFVSRGAIITIGMVTVALGYACAENLLYVFGYSAPGVKSEAITLIMRSIFPIHPICAAIQSIGVIKRDIELNKSIHIGRIIYPSWIVHGTFDFILMVITTYMSLEFTNDPNNNTEEQIEQQEENQEDNDNAVQGEFQSWQDVINALPILGASMIILLLSILYYIKEAKKQRQRLEQFDQGRSLLQCNEENDDYESIPIHSSIPG